MEQILSQKIEMIKNDMKTKKLEELLEINDHVENYVDNYVKQEQLEIEKIQKEIDNQVEINKLKLAIEKKQKDVQNLLEEKKKLEKEFSKDKIINQLKQEIEEKYNKPKHLLINELKNGNINFEQYIQKFKEYGMKYNYYSLIIEELKNKL